MHGTAPTADVIIVGAGVAGLSAAVELARAGVRVQILEGTDRIGGRLKSEKWACDASAADSVTIEHGANWVHGTNGKNPIECLADAMSLEGTLDEDRDGCRVVCATTGNDLTAESEDRNALLDGASEQLELIQVVEKLALLQPEATVQVSHL